MLTSPITSTGGSSSSPWKSTPPPAVVTASSSLKRKLDSSADDAQAAQQIKPIPLGGSTSLEVVSSITPTSRKKSQMQKNLEDILTVFAYTAPQLSTAARNAYGRLNDELVDTEDRETELERISRILELSALKGINAYEQCKGYEERFSISVDEVMEETKTLPVGRRLELLTHKAFDIVHAFTDLSTEMENHESHLSALIDQFEDLLREVANMKHSAEDALTETVQKHDEMTSKCAKLDRELEEIIASQGSSSNRRSASRLSVTLDVLQSGDPKIIQLLQERRHANEMLRITRDDFDARSRELEYFKIVAGMCELAGQKMDENLAESRLRGFNNRNPTIERGFALVRSIVSHLEGLIQGFGKLQQQREAAASEKLSKLTQELDAHSKLYGQDEAQTERKDLEGRIAEFNEVVRRSRLAVQQCVQKQVELWNSTGIPEPIRKHVIARLGPIIRSLPFQKMFDAELALFASSSSSSLTKSTDLVPLLQNKQQIPYLASGYDSDDFFETDETSSSAGSSVNEQMLSLVTRPMSNNKSSPSNKANAAGPLLLMSSSEDDDFGNMGLISSVAVNQQKQQQQQLVEDRSEDGGSGCVIM